MFVASVAARPDRDVPPKRPPALETAQRKGRTRSDAGDRTESKLPGKASTPIDEIVETRASTIPTLTSVEPTT
jgi:hypothetical protein